jgi:hypothetical protein
MICASVILEVTSFKVTVGSLVSILGGNPGIPRFNHICAKTSSCGTPCPDEYKISFDTQTVVRWWPGLSEIPERLVNCSVRDKNNWRCEHPDDPSSEIKMVDGRIVDDDPDTKYVYSFVWHYMNIKSLLLD